MLANQLQIDSDVHVTFPIFVFKALCTCIIELNCFTSTIHFFFFVNHHNYVTFFPVEN